MFAYQKMSIHSHFFSVSKFCNQNAICQNKPKDNSLSPKIEREWIVVQSAIVTMQIVKTKLKISPYS